LFVPRAKVRGLTYKGTNEEGGYDEYTLDKDPTVVLVVVPQGGYIRGAVPDDEFAEPDEKPRQWVTISAFLISRTEITWAQYLRFCKASDYQLPPGISERGLLLDHPVTQVTWADAKAYCKWAGLRLLTESEWEFAARFGTDGGVWPWGSNWVEEPANVASMRGNTTSVASYDATGDLKLHDMVGNVGEWCEDWYAENEYDELPERDPMGPKSGTTRVVRGGSWQHPKKEARLSARRGVEPDTRHAELGFRVGMNATIR
jgi:formylglycine-generating enzyme required for sulfatase activity